MTHDHLVQFAAEKVGAKIAYDQSEGLGWRYEWEPGRWRRFDLTSPDLMLKGMEVCPCEVSIHASPEGRARYIYFHSMETWDEQMVFYDKASDLPRTFWAAWAKLEKGEG